MEETKHDNEISKPIIFGDYFRFHKEAIMNASNRFVQEQEIYPDGPLTKREGIILDRLIEEKLALELVRTRLENDWYAMNVNSVRYFLGSLTGRGRLNEEEIRRRDDEVKNTDMDAVLEKLRQQKAEYTARAEERFESTLNATDRLITKIEGKKKGS